MEFTSDQVPSVTSMPNTELDANANGADGRQAESSPARRQTTSAGGAQPAKKKQKRSSAAEPLKPGKASKGNQGKGSFADALKELGVELKPTRQIPIEDILCTRDRAEHQASFEAFVDHLKVFKVIVQPITVRREGKKFRVVAGHRRYLAALEARARHQAEQLQKAAAGEPTEPPTFGTIPCQELVGGDATVDLMIANIENAFRLPPKPVEVVRGLKQVKDQGQLSVTQLAEIYGFSKGTMSDLLQATEMDEEILKQCDDKEEVVNGKAVKRKEKSLFKLHREWKKAKDGGGRKSPPRGRRGGCTSEELEDQAAATLTLNGKAARHHLDHDFFHEEPRFYFAVCVLGGEDGKQPHFDDDLFRAVRDWYDKLVCPPDEKVGQPTRKKKTFQPTGMPIKNYFPSVVDDEVFFKAQRAMKSRSRTGGRTCNGVNNLFTNLVVGDDGTTYSLRPRNYHLYLVRRSVMAGLVKDMPAVPYVPFERACFRDWRYATRVGVRSTRHPRPCRPRGGA